MLRGFHLSLSVAANNALDLSDSGGEEELEDIIEDFATQTSMNMVSILPFS